MPPKQLLSIPNAVRISNRGYLPHWQLDGAVYFITYRLADSLPIDVIEALKSYRRNLIAQMTHGERPPTFAEKATVRRAFERQFDLALDASYGAAVLGDPRAARIVTKNLKHFDDSRYELQAYCVMPNHVHVLLGVTRGEKIEAIVHSWKSYTSCAINQLLGRRGVLWQREYYDRIVRSFEEFTETRAYIINNPAKAGLRNWPFVWSRE